jgi:hypothetical protein
MKPRLLTSAVALALFGLASAPAAALDISAGELSGSWDNTFSYGATWRVEDPDEDNLGKSWYNPAAFTLDNAGQRATPGRWSVNNDDGNVNFPDKWDITTHTMKWTSELDLTWRNFGAFTRFSVFYDFVYSDTDFLAEDAEDRVGNDFRLLDLYIWGDHQIGDRFLNWRLGRQVVSWGESTFIQGGINTINSVDVSRLRTAGSELKEAFEGVNMLWASMDLTDSLALEALYMFEWRETLPDPAGSFFGSNDIATPGGSYAMLGFGAVPQPVINPDLYTTVCLEGNLAASDRGLPPQLIGAGCSASFPRADTIEASDSGQYGAALRWFVESLNSTEFGFYYLNYHSRLPLISGSAVTSTALSSGRYWTEYPEDLKLYGASFNTNVGTWSWSGEVSYRPNAPLQIDDVEVLFAGLTPLNILFPPDILKFKSQLGEFQAGELIKGWEEHDSWQIQSTVLKVFGPNNPFKADQISFVAEVGANYVSDLPSWNELRYNGPGTDTGGGPDYLTGDFRNPQTQVTGFADDFSWGYRAAARFDYNNAIGAWTLSPRIAWAHDVDGITPGPGGSFIDGRKQATLGVAANYLNTWIFDLSYTYQGGAGMHNELRDRDFVAASVSYSF